MEGLLLALLGRDRAWRLGRRLYTAARGEKPSNAIAENGEAGLIDAVLRATPAERAAVLWDVGANRGEWSQYALATARRLDRKLALHVFEPTPEAAELLETRFAAEPGAQVHRLALSDRDGRARFAVVGGTAGTNSLELDGVDAAARLVEVEVAQGDSFAAAQGLSAIDLVKIDTEGHDYAVLSGLMNVLRRHAAGIVQFEYNSRWIGAHRALRDVFEIAAETGYALGRVDRAGIELFDHWNPECDRFFEDNYALVSPRWQAAPFVRARRWSESNTLL